MIKPADIDSTIQGALKERLAQIFVQQAALDPLTARVKAAGLRAWRETCRKYAARFRGAGLLFAGSLLSLPLLTPTHEGLGVLVFLGLNAVAVALLVGTHRKVQGELTRYVNADVMRGASRLVALSRAEQRYCEAVAALVDAGDTLLGEETQEDILAQLNELLASYRKLERPIQHFRSTSASQSVRALEQELAELERTRDAQADPTARQTMEQSIALCSARLEHARRIEPVREQAEAQQEYIVQTLASVQGSLSRIAGTGTPPLSAEVMGLREAVHRVHQRAGSVEAAVVELQALGAGV